MSDTLRQTLLHLWTINPQLPGTSPLRHFTPFVHSNKPRRQRFTDKESVPKLKSTPDGSIKLLSLSTYLHPKNKKQMLYFLIDFGDLGIDGLIDIGALSSAILEADLDQIKHIATQKILKERSPPDFQIMLATRQLETPIATTELQSEVIVNIFLERIIFLADLANPLIGHLFFHPKGTVFDMRQRILYFPSFSHAAQECNRLTP